MHKQDPMTHRIIEKRRRDRMNTCLADLNELIPPTYAKRFRNRGRIEKTEIIEMAIRHIKNLQAYTYNQTTSKTTHEERVEHYRQGYQESMSESIRFLVEIEGLYSNSDACMRLVGHHQNHFDKIVKGRSLTTPRGTVEFRTGKGEDRLDDETVAHFQNTVCGKNTNQSKKMKCDENSFRTGNSTTNGHHLTGDIRLQNPNIPPYHSQYSNSETGSSKHSSNSIPTFVGDKSHTTESTTKGFYETMSKRENFLHCKTESKAEDFYKFKKTIKERFAAGLQQHPGFDAAEARNESDACPSLYSAGLPKVKQTSANHTAPYKSYSLQKSGSPLDNAEMDPAYPVIEDPLDSVDTQSNNYVNHLSQSTGGSSSGYNTDDSKHKLPFSELSSATSYGSPSENSPIPQTINPTSTTPIFALHPNGNFYVPLNISTSSIEPYIRISPDSIQSLHPVSISINYSSGQANQYPLLAHEVKLAKKNHVYFKDCEPQY